jgi:predicted ATP-dependent endonuclease of OLD family
LHISALRVSNFRRLKDIQIDLAEDISILVGSNNSGKTSSAHVLELFISQKDKLSVHDFNSDAWAEMNDFGDGVAGAVLPKIFIDVWFSIEQADLGRVIDLMPRLTWQGSEVGVRIEFAANEPTALMQRFIEARTKAQQNVKYKEDGVTVAFHPSPKTLYEYLADNLNSEFGLSYYVLDRGRFSDAYIANAGYVPNLITPEKGRSGKEVLNSLVKIEVLNAQRHLSDKAGGHRAEDLSRHLSRYYNRNLEKRNEDYDAMQALSESEKLLNEHLEKVFKPMLNQLSELGYPEHPKLLIRSALDPATLMSASDNGTKVHYVLNPGEPEPLTLPDSYNGLGFKNLIYMVVELLDRHARWLEIEEDRPPLHLIFIEEPEVHLHAQLQQVFIRKVMEILTLTGDDALSCKSQFLVTTHSPHILYERGFRPIRYFRRSPSTQTHQSCEVLNLSLFYNNTDPATSSFLERYMKLTHCDLFFADAAILVEGNVERLLLPQMIEKEASRLKATCLSILEVGGAFGYRFRTLIEFLGLTALIVTDIDSVLPSPATPAALATAQPQDDPEDPEEDDAPAAGSACLVSAQDAVTSNQTLIQWLPGYSAIADLLAATAASKTQAPANQIQAHVRVAYQQPCTVTWQGVTETVTGRTLEEAFALQNLAWCQDIAQKEIKLRIGANSTKPLSNLILKIHNRVKGSSFKKTDFALALLTRDPATWNVPSYISDGLKWLETQVRPEEVVVPPTQGGAQ